MIKLKESPTTFGDIFHLTSKRTDEIVEEMKPILAGLMDKYSATGSLQNKDPLEALINLGKTENEQAFCIFQAGMKTQEIYNMSALHPLKKLLQNLSI